MIYANYLLQKNQTRKTGFGAFMVPERYDCKKDEHVREILNIFNFQIVIDIGINNTVIGIINTVLY